MLEIASVIYVIIGVGLCIWCQMGSGNAANWWKYPVLVFSWPVVLIWVAMDGEY